MGVSMLSPECAQPDVRIPEFTVTDAGPQGPIDKA